MEELETAVTLEGVTVELGANGTFAELEGTRVEDWEYELYINGRYITNIRAGDLSKEAIKDLGLKIEE